ncbi:DUF3307 domain-containing protein [Kangiella sediminilitoris]|uniref:DUF3307 domain-containing protein n=1 Tax=Kangiella sediminilitoris TaxID=1144748 RepID=A0A1B3B9J2_9GAMM|nr:DUF3307 domain-containing protein [Kangiella sediminilitoris]AOE49426.1 hypothetical protein KS2013_702 [Kangiella sediminilitoris]
MTVLLLKLIMAHLIADFLIQPLGWIQDKEKKAFVSNKLILHSLVHATLYAMAFGFAPEYWLGWTVLLVTHYLIDGFKSISNRLVVEENSTFFNRRSLFFMDQLLHIAIIFLVVGYYHPELYQYNLDAEQLWLLAIALLLLTRVSSIVIKVLISRWSPLNVNDAGQTNHSLANAGSYIGFLERLFIFVFIVTNHWEGVGFLLAAKSVFRFGDLKEAHDRRLTEYILIGTLISFGLAIGISLGYVYFKSMI